MSTNNNDNVSSEATSITSDDIVKNDDTGKRGLDADYADPETDQDPRTSNTGVTSIGASDLNADEAQDGQQDSEAVPGVRRGDGEASYE